MTTLIRAWCKRCQTATTATRCPDEGTMPVGHGMCSECGWCPECGYAPAEGGPDDEYDWIDDDE